MLQFKITYEGAASGKIAKRALNNIKKGGFKTLGVVWHKQFRPKHFTRAGAAEYGYRPRSRDYENRKQKRFGHRDPLVYTGESRTRARIRNVKATSKGNRISLGTPRINFSGRASELRVISRTEKGVLINRMQRHMVKELNDLKGRETAVA